MQYVSKHQIQRQAPRRRRRTRRGLSRPSKFKATKVRSDGQRLLPPGIDTAQADQASAVRSALTRASARPSASSRSARAMLAPKAPGERAVRPGADDLVAEIEKGWMDFDVAIASPDMMRVVSKLGKVLGPKGPDAQPQGRHRDDQRPREPSGIFGRQRSVSRGQRAATSRRDRQDELRDSDLVENLTHFIGLPSKRFARPPPSGVYIKNHRQRHHDPWRGVKYVTAAVAEE